MSITIIICTYNRGDILSHCIDSLCRQSVKPDVFKILIVDNNSIDNTRDIVQKYQKLHENIEYVIEQNQGLSYARNRGAQEADSEWVVYLDDDGRAPRNFVEKAIELSTKSFDCFGGAYNAWHLYDPPQWLPLQFGSSPRFATQVTTLDKAYLSGGIFAIKRSILLAVGLFKTELGMKGNAMGYGEETELQDRLRHKGYTIGYDPSFYMDHLVNKQKYKLEWHLRNEYTHGRDLPHIWHGTSKYYHITKWSLKTLLVIVQNSVLGAFKLPFDRNYYKENYIIDTKGKIEFLRGLYSNI